MSACRHSELLNLESPSGGRVFVDAASIVAIGSSVGKGKPGDADYAPTLTRLVVQGRDVYVRNTPEEVLVLRLHVLGIDAAPSAPSTANGRRIMPPSEQLDWQYPDVVKTTDIGPVSVNAQVQS